MLCDKNHVCEISFANFQQDKRCNICRGKNKFSYEYVNNYFNQFNYTLLSTEYINNHTKLKIKCPEGHIFEMPFYVFKDNGSRCPQCARDKQSKRQLYTYDYVKSFIETESNCELLDDEYIRSNQKLNIKCSCGNVFKTTFSKFKSGKRQCNKCGIKIAGNKRKYKYHEVFDIFKNANCILLSTEYNNNSELLHYICECGNESYISLNNFIAGQRCKECGVIKQAKSLYENGNVACSNQQKYLNNLFGGKLNYPIGKYNVDICFPEEKIYIEYDGGGHDLRVKLNLLTYDEFNKKEISRNYYLMRRGWKQIRIISSNDKLPSDGKLLYLLNYARDYLNLGHHYIIFDIDKNNIITSQFIKPYNYKPLYILKNEVA